MSTVFLDPHLETAPNLALETPTVARELMSWRLGWEPPQQAFPHVASSGDVLPIWPWVLRWALSSCGWTMLSVGSGTPFSLPSALSLSSLPRAPIDRALIVTTGFCVPGSGPGGGHPERMQRIPGPMP